MTRADMSTGVLQNALVAFQLRNEVAESLTGVRQNGHKPSARKRKRSGGIVDKGRCGGSAEALHDLFKVSKR